MKGAMRPRHEPRRGNVRPLYARERAAFGNAPVSALRCLSFHVHRSWRSRPSATSASDARTAAAGPGSSRWTTRTSPPSAVASRVGGARFHPALHPAAPPPGRVGADRQARTANASSSKDETAPCSPSNPGNAGASRTPGTSPAGARCARRSRRSRLGGSSRRARGIKHRVRSARSCRTDRPVLHAPACMRVVSTIAVRERETCDWPAARSFCP